MHSTVLVPIVFLQFIVAACCCCREERESKLREERAREERAREEREIRFVASKLSLITLMHSWPGKLSHASSVRYGICTDLQSYQRGTKAR